MVKNYNEKVSSFRVELMIKYFLNQLDNVKTHYDHVSQKQCAELVWCFCGIHVKNAQPQSNDKKAPSDNPCWGTFCGITGQTSLKVWEDCLFTLLIVSFVVQKLLSLIRSHFFIFAFVSITLGSGSWRILRWFMSESVLPMFSSRSFIVSVFLPGEFHEQRSLVDCSLQCGKESDTTEWLTLSFLVPTWWDNSKVEAPSLKKVFISFSQSWTILPKR